MTGSALGEAAVGAPLAPESLLQLRRDEADHEGSDLVHSLVPGLDSRDRVRVRPAAVT